MDIGKQRRALVPRRRVRKARHGRVKQLPGGAAQFGFQGLVAEFGHDGGALEGAFLDVDVVDGRAAVVVGGAGA